MKNLIFALFALFAFAATAQDVVRDSSWLIFRDNKFVQVRNQVFNNGGETIVFSPIGDTLATTNAFTQQIQTDATRLANDALVVSGYRQLIADIIRMGGNLPAMLARSPLDSIAATNVELYSANYWRVNYSLGLMFRKSGANYEWSSDTSAVWRPFAYIGSVMRLTNFNGYTTDFFRVPNSNAWRTVDQRFQITPRLRAGSRAALTPIEVPEKEPPATDVTLNANGTVTIGQTTFRYNTRKKTWAKQ